LVTEEVLLATAASRAPATTRSRAARLAEQAHSDWVIPRAELTCTEMVKRTCAVAGFEPTSSPRRPTSVPLRAHPQLRPQRPRIRRIVEVLKDNATRLLRNTARHGDTMMVDGDELSHFPAVSPRGAGHVAGLV
jgi:hypothetical protein